MQNIGSFTDFKLLIESNDMVLAYFSHERCSVCKVLLPKVKGLLASDFPKVKMAYCDIEQVPETAAQNSVFTAPTLLIFVQSKEYMRYSRNVGLDPLAQTIARPYKMLF